MFISLFQEKCSEACKEEPKRGARKLSGCSCDGGQNGDIDGASGHCRRCHSRIRLQNSNQLLLSSRELATQTHLESAIISLSTSAVPGRIASAKEGAEEDSAESDAAVVPPGHVVVLQRELAVHVESEHAVVEGRSVERDELCDRHPSARSKSATCASI